MKQPLSTRIPTRAATVLTCTVYVVDLMTGCSQGSEANSAVSTSAASGDDHLFKMAKCMRDKGIDIFDPGANGNMQFPDSGIATKAAQECGQIVDSAPGTGGLTKPETQQDLVKTAECLHKEDCGVPDPEVGKGIQLNGDIPQDVMNECFPQVGNK